MTQRVVNYTYGTGNPVLPDGSIDVRDGIDNLQSFDIFMNAGEDTYNQRDGEIVRTVAGMNNEFDTQILNMGFTRIGTFAAGATMTNPRQTLLWDVADGGDGQEYGWSGLFTPSGKVVPSGSTPLTTGGIAVGAWMSRFDPELRIQVRESLRRSYAEAGYNLVGGSFEVGGALVNVNDVLLQERTGKAFSGPAGVVPAGANPASGGFVDVSNRILSIPYAGYYDNIAAALSDPRNVDTEMLLPKGGIIGGLIAKDCDLKGFGYSTIISDGPEGYAIKAMRSLPDWERRTISRLELKSTNNTGTRGIIYDPNDSYAGRWDTSYIGIDGFEIGIYKPQGNIGNSHRAVNFRNMPYGFKAKDGTLDYMHSGCERFEDCTWGGITTWCIDIEGRTDGFGQIVIGDSIMENCAGGGVRLDMGNKTPYLPVVIKNLWFEGIAKAASVTRDGVPETPRQIKLIDTPIAFAEECYLSNVELINSKMIATKCRVDDISTYTYNMVIDASSSLTLVDVFANGPIGPNPLVQSVSSQRWPCGNRNLSLRGNPPTRRQANAAGGIVKAKETYSGTVGSTIWSFPGTESAVAYCVADGVISANCAELFIGAGNTQQSVLQADITTGKWYVWGVNAKLVSGSGTFNFTNTASLGSIYTEQGKWVSTFGIGKAEATGKARLYMTAITATVIRLQDYFVVEFDKESDALAFCNARVAIS